MILVKCHAPGAKALGASNGLVQFSMCLTRAFSPAFVSSVFAFSLDYNVLGGHFWAIVMIVISALGAMTSRGIESGNVTIDPSMMVVGALE